MENKIVRTRFKRFWNAREGSSSVILTPQRDMGHFQLRNDKMQTFRALMVVMGDLL